MKYYARQLRRTIAAVLVVFAGCVLAISAYALWRLRADAVTGGFDFAAMHAQRFEGVLTQSLHATELIAADLLERLERIERIERIGHNGPIKDVQGIGRDFAQTLRRLPFLRSMSLLDAHGTIVASSNAANVGRVVSTSDGLPAPAVDGVLRIGRPWIGRDFATGWPSAEQPLAASDSASFVPLALTLAVGQQRLTLLVALNTDYFANDLVQKIDATQGRVDALRYDGVRLLASDPDALPGARRDVRALKLPDVESGRYAARAADGSELLAVYRASSLYPLVVVAEIRRDHALRHWYAEAVTLFAVLATVLLAVFLLSVAFYRRQLQMLEQRAELRRLQRINAMVFTSSPVAIAVADQRGVIVSVNAEYERVTGYRGPELTGRSLFELLTRDSATLFAERSSRLPLDGQPGSERAIANFEVEQRCRDGASIWMEVSPTPECNARGTLTGYHYICRNISERKQMEDRVRQLALHDALTQLPNRRLLADRLHQTMAANSRSRRYAALMFLDLDNFKPLNDAHGHGAGDLLLVEVARRLQGCVREADTVARFGGDEFVVMLAELSRERDESEAQALAIAEKVRDALAAPYRLASGNAAGTLIEHRCSASIGVALFLGHEASQDEVLKWADAAMYEAKTTRRGIHFHAHTDG